MKILITGGTGFLGQQLCRVLLHENHQLTVLSRKPDIVFSRYQAKVRAIARLADLTREDHFDEFSRRRHCRQTVDKST